MADLAPTLSGGIAFEQPVQRPDVLSSIASLANTFASALPNKAPSKESQEIKLKHELVSGLQKAQVLREQGNTRAALNLERKSMLNFSLGGGDLNSGDTQSLIKTYTGFEAESVGFTEEEQAFNKMVEAPEFHSAFLSTYASHPEASEQERIKIAGSRVQAAAANEALIQETKIDWNSNQGQSSRIAKIEGWRQSASGVLTLSDTVDQNAVQQAQIEFASLRASIVSSRPAGISGEEWKPVQDALDATQKQLDLAERLTSNDEVSSDILRGFIDAISALPDATAAEKNIAIQVMMKNPETFLEKGAIQEGRLQDIFKAANDIFTEQNAASLEKGNGGGDVLGEDDPSSFTKEEKEAAKGNPTQQFKRASDLAHAANGVSNVLKDEEALSQWIGLTRSGLASLHSMAAENTAWASSEGYRRYFNENFFQTMDGLRNSGSTFTYDAMRAKSIEAIDANLTALRASLTSIGSSGFVSYDRASNSLKFDRQDFENHPRISTAEKRMFLRLLESKYGGDFEAAIGDRGSNLPSVRAIAEEIYEGREEVSGRIRAIKQLEAFKERLPASESLTGGEGTEGLDGRQGEDTLQNITYTVPEHVRSDTRFLQAVSNTASRLRVDSSDLLRVMQFETGGSFDPAQKNAAGSGATGLIQFMPATAKELGVTTDKLAAMDRAEQMYFVEKYLEGKLRGLEEPTFGDLYMAILYPVAVGKDDSYVLFKKGTKAYTQNKGLDTDGSGTITKGEAVAKAFGRTSGVVLPQPAPDGTMEVSLRPPEALPIRPIEAPQSTSGTPLATTDTPRSASEATRAASSDSQVVTPSKPAQQVWGKLEAQTKRMLVRLFGSEEEALLAIEKGEVSEEDL